MYQSRLPSNLYRLRIKVCVPQAEALSRQRIGPMPVRPDESKVLLYSRS